MIYKLYESYIEKYLINFWGYKKITITNEQDINFVLDYLKTNSSEEAFKNISNYFININEKNKSFLVPAYGVFKWKYNDDTFYFKFKEEGPPIGKCEKIKYFVRLEIYHSEINKLKEFVVTMFNQKDKEDKMLNVFVNAQGGYWDTIRNVYGQDLDHVYLPQSMKNNIITDIDNFVNAKDKYLNFGIPYKKCYLFTGVPGTGKTSLIKALVKKYKYNLYFLNLSKITDSELIMLISCIKENSFLIIEDIDALFIDRNAEKLSISFSGLINVMDGIVSNMNGIITILTANHPEKLDAALMRSGRVDIIYKFEHAKEVEIKIAFDKLTGKDNFAEFYNHIKSMKLSMADIVTYLFKYQDNYIENIDTIKSQQKLRHEFNGTEKTNRLYS